MSASVSELYSKLTVDTWRQQAGFSEAFRSAQSAIFRCGSDLDGAERQLATWLSSQQPCLFGRIAAKMSLLSYCVLTEKDLQASDGSIRDKIQNARLEWLKQAFEGRKSGFVIWVISEKIAEALPNDDLKRLAQRLCSLYLLGKILPDQIYLDEIFLEHPGPGHPVWKWNVGANYFCANGDKRWWQDHRIPAGMAFSMNSVGHMVRSTIVSKKLEELESLLRTEANDVATTKLDSLMKALEFAMRTINIASDTPSGRATELLPLPSDPSLLPVSPCPVSLPSFLQGHNYCEYAGYYDTDVTIPSEYFSDVVDRPKDQQRHKLDFTYLFHDDVENPDFISTGKGRRIHGLSRTTKGRTMKSVAYSTSIDRHPLLRRALERENPRG